MFNITSGKILVTDPCYEKTDELTGMAALPVVNGQWRYSYEMDGHSVSELTAHVIGGHSSPYRLEHITDEIYVDSGQAGFFDFDQYPEGNTGESNDPDSFYGKCCKLTLSSDQLGDLGFGVVSSSGMGDGSYTLEGHKNEDGLYDYLKLTFIDEDEVCPDCGEAIDYCTCYEEDEDEDDNNDYEDEDEF